MRHFTVVFTLKADWRPTTEGEWITSRLERSGPAEDETHALSLARADFHGVDAYDAQVVEN